MTSRIMLAVACVGLVAGAGMAGELKSGPAVGKGVPAFNPLNVTGDDAGEKRCQV